jgi:hypothetical protein
MIRRPGNPGAQRLGEVMDADARRDRCEQVAHAPLAAVTDGLDVLMCAN